MSKKKKLSIQAELNGRQARYLRGLGHHLQAKVYIGKEGVTDTVVQSVLETLVAHELVKVKLQDTCPTDRQATADLLREKTGGAIAQLLGRTILIYKRNKDKKYKENEERIILP